MFSCMQRAALRWQKRGSETGQGASTSQAGRERYRRMSEPGTSQLLRSPLPRLYTQAIPPSAFSLRIRGLPLDATAAEVASFFSGKPLKLSAHSLTGGIQPHLESIEVDMQPGHQTPANSEIQCPLFYADFQVLPDAVEILTVASPSGQVVSTGMANIKFASPAAAEAARQRQNGLRLRSSIVECLPLAPQLQAQPFAGANGPIPAVFESPGSPLWLTYS